MKVSARRERLKIDADELYQGDKYLGEWIDGKFVPSRALLESPVVLQRQVAAFVRNNKPK